MSNEQTPMEDQNQVAQADAATTPIDLASAFKMLNQANRETAQGDVGSGGNLEDNGSIEQDVSNGSDQSVDDGEDGSSPEPNANGGESSYDGGSADSIEAIDFNAYKQDLLRNIQRNAASEVRREFNEQNIGYYSAAELTVRDEQTGQVRFRNPDVQDERDPNYYFKSRSEMQQFIQAWNQGVDFEFRKAVNEKQRDLMNQAAPTARLMDFYPKWQAMDDDTKAIFDELLEGHEIRDANGKEIGYNVNLDTVAAQAAKIAKRFQSQPQQTQQAEAQASASQGNNGPALDMKTGNGSSQDEKEPTSIGEALKMLDNKNKGGK